MLRPRGEGLCGPASAKSNLLSITVRSTTIGSMSREATRGSLSDSPLWRREDGCFLNIGSAGSLSSDFLRYLGCSIALDSRTFETRSYQELLIAKSDVWNSLVGFRSNRIIIKSTVLKASSNVLVRRCSKYLQLESLLDVAYSFEPSRSSDSHISNIASTLTSVDSVRSVQVSTAIDRKQFAEAEAFALDFSGCPSAHGRKSAERCRV